MDRAGRGRPRTAKPHQQLHNEQRGTGHSPDSQAASCSAPNEPSPGAEQAAEPTAQRPQQAGLPGSGGSSSPGWPFPAPPRQTAETVRERARREEKSLGRESRAPRSGPCTSVARPSVPGPRSAHGQEEVFVAGVLAGASIGITLRASPGARARPPLLRNRAWPEGLRRTSRGRRTRDPIPATTFY